MYSTKYWLDCLFFFLTYRLYSLQPNQLQKAKPSNIMKHFTTYQSALTHTSWWRHLLACYCWIVKVWQEYFSCWRYVSLLIGTTAAAVSTVSRARGREAKSSQSPTDWENQFCVSGCHNRHLDSPALCVSVFGKSFSVSGWRGRLGSSAASWRMLQYSSLQGALQVGTVRLSGCN